jgi:lactoylglutathione lyase
MIPIEGLFEAHISVRDFKRSVAFYRDVVGLELGIAQPERPAAFLGSAGAAAQ